ncbi:class I SAM-dependent methyltransferase [Marinobacter orientalis]|uniref:Class I SAM-dependent methyltransferase n=1 Tax=Marinobacter orientalis TaxID=1928859 RepID=A0A7Y0RFC9_9GAMM|nr:class I SAM-dependent methyltransferase [Marinobacter orientalis]NMT65226.1 class I SAM-dependent methyltransferase [Marinobacter orientalis]TGX48005.1 class I SAM-dependent methyltransferase [Marinobacter orientalis]
MSRLTETSYWDATYTARPSLQPIEVTGYRNLSAEKNLEVMESVGIENKRVLEVGGGGSAWLAFFASHYPDSEFTALDYSDEGCALVRDYANERGLLNLHTVCADMFDPEAAVGQFDLVYSHGVVEHFTDLAATLAPMKNFLAHDGRLVTFIPNMSGILGALTRKFNRAVYEIHVPHDRESFVKGHKDAGLEILECGYLDSTNFGVLSSCFEHQSGIKWQFYKQLARLSKILWAFESRVFRLPTSRLFSPYIYAIAKKP